MEMDQAKNQAEMSGQAPAVYYQPQGPAPPPGYYGQPPPGQQQPYVVVQQQQPTVVIVGSPPGKSYAMHIALACCAFWCCGGFFGLAAFFIALCAHVKSSSNPEGADRLAKISLIVSVVGLVIGSILFIYYMIQFVSGAHWLYNTILEMDRNITYGSQGRWRNGSLPQNSTRVHY